MCTNEVKSEFNKFLGLSEETHKVHKGLLGLLPDDEAEKHDIWYQAKMFNVQDFVAVTKKCLVEAQGCSASMLDDNEQNYTQVQGGSIVDNDEKDETHTKDDENQKGKEPQIEAAAGGMKEEEFQIEPHDSISNVASKSSRRHHKGSTATGSSSSNTSSTASERIKAEAERAALLGSCCCVKGEACSGGTGTTVNEKKRAALIGHQDSCG